LVIGIVRKRHYMTLNILNTVTEIKREHEREKERENEAACV